MKNKQNLTQNRDFLMICQMINIHNNQFLEFVISSIAYLNTRR